MAFGGRSREEPIVAQWVLPLKGVIQSINDISLPPDALYSASNVELQDGTLRGRRGLLQLGTGVFTDRPTGQALNYWQNVTAGWIVVGTLSTIWTIQLAGNVFTNRIGTLSGNADNPIRTTQFNFGTPPVNHAYICNGVNNLREWNPSELRARGANLGPEKVTNGSFATAASWTFGAGWTFDGVNLRANHTSGGGTAALEQNVGAIAGEEYQIVYDIPTGTIGTVTPAIGGVSGFAETSFGLTGVSQIITATGTGNLQFLPSNLFDGSITNVSVKKIQGPIFRDVTVGGDRIVGIVGSHTIQWSEVLIDSFPASNTKIFNETPSPLTACRVLGNIGVAAYKKDAIWLGELTGLAFGSAFRWTIIQWAEGPANPAALVEVFGLHVYMTRTGRIGVFNGVSHEWVADGVWPIVKAEIDVTAPGRVHGVFLPQLFQVRFYYQRTGQTTTDGCVILHLKRPQIGLPYASFPGRMGRSITASCSIYADGFDTSFLFADLTFKTYQMSQGVNDDGILISSNIQHPLVPAPALEEVRIFSMEPYLERGGGFGTLTCKSVVSNVLDAIAGIQSTGFTVDLTTVKVKEWVGTDQRGRFLAMRLEWDSTATVRYRGATLRAPNERPPDGGTGTRTREG